MKAKTTMDQTGVVEFGTDQGAKIFRIPIIAFPGFWVYAYLVIVDEMIVLIDTGSNVEASNNSLEQGMESVSEILGSSMTFSDLTHIFISHGHIDHFGGMAYLKGRTNAKVGVHELDRRILTNYEERLVVVSKRVKEFLIESGVPDELNRQILDMYMLTKSLFSSVNVDFTFGEEGMQVGPFEMLHVPGHCAGMVMIKLHDVIFSADHVLADITPHQSPEHLTMQTGLGHYLESLEKARSWGKGVPLTLGSHKAPIKDLGGRIDQIRLEHVQRLNKIMDILDRPMTITEISTELFGSTSGYNILLALEEAGAHIEYLYQRGFLGIDNLAEVRDSDLPLPIVYSRIEDRIDPVKYFPIVGG